MDTDNLIGPGIIAAVIAVIVHAGAANSRRTAAMRKAIAKAVGMPSKAGGGGGSCGGGAGCGGS